MDPKPCLKLGYSRCLLVLRRITKAVLARFVDGLLALICEVLLLTTHLRPHSESSWPLSRFRNGKFYVTSQWARSTENCNRPNPSKYCFNLRTRPPMQRLIKVPSQRCRVRNWRTPTVSVTFSLRSASSVWVGIHVRRESYMPRMSRLNFSNCLTNTWQSSSRLTIPLVLSCPEELVNNLYLAGKKSHPTWAQWM